MMLLWSLLIIVIMIRKTSCLAAAAASNNDRIRVAILGSGISGSTAAATLLESTKHSLDVSVYEAGRGIGGRMSTRRIVDEGGNLLYQFDHGCQYISTPKTECFRKELEKWKERRWVEPWQGTFATISCAPSSTSSGSSNGETQLYIEDTAKERYVGYPSMNAICEHLLQTISEHSTLSVSTGKQARAVQVNSDDQSPWQIYHNNELLGSYDWLIVTDRNSAQEARKDLADATVAEYKQVNKQVKSIKSITAMIAFEKRLPLPFDGITFDYNSNPAVMRDQFKSLGWAARDSSKPGRTKENDCWVLQSNPEEAARLLSEFQDASLPQIREVIRERMVSDFIESIPTLTAKSSGSDGMEEATLPKIVDSIGHRWGAAFPSFTKQQTTENDNAFKDKECLILPEEKFAACGDYFGSFHGRVEGAFLSGRAAANEVLKFNR